LSRSTKIGHQRSTALSCCCATTGQPFTRRDLAGKVKFDQYQVDRSIYVIDVRQSLNMQQVFESWSNRAFPKRAVLPPGLWLCQPAGRGHVSPARPVVLFKDVADEAVRRVLEVIAEKNPGLPEQQQQIVANQGSGALVYSMLSVDNNKDTVFDMDAALSCGHTARTFKTPCPGE
jgi:arginyl-tRNA synthetase